MQKKTQGKAHVARIAAAIGGVSSPSKMPCYGWSIPAAACATGGKLRKVPGSACFGCYAHKGRYGFGNVRNALQNRLAIFNALQASGRLDSWVDTLAEIASDPSSNGFFRWFDSGDLQSETMLDAICSVARKAPSVQFWLPTQERAILRGYIRKGNRIPHNLTIRVSSPMVGKPVAEKGFAASAISGKGEDRIPSIIGARCPAYTQQGKCGDCRTCWDSSVPLVVYPVH